MYIGASYGGGEWSTKEPANVKDLIRRRRKYKGAYPKKEEYTVANPGKMDYARANERMGLYARASSGAEECARVNPELMPR